MTMSEIPQRQKKEAKEIILNTIDLISILVLSLEDRRYKKKLSYPKFNLQEVRFIRELIFWKPKGLVFFYLADHLMNNTLLRYLPMLNAPSMKKLRFIFNFFNSKSAKEAAIKAGYSPKTAKQQAYRTLREIHGYKRPH